MLEFYEPLLDFSMPEYQSIMGVILSLRDPVDGKILRCVVEEMRERFPYFYVKAANRGDDLVTVPNDLPMTVRNTWEPIRLHSEASNYHLAAWKYEGRRLAFEIHHALTDGSGVLPYIKSIMYLYLSRITGQTFDPAGFCLPGDVIPGSETGNPFNEPDIDNVETPLYQKKPIPDFFRLTDTADNDKTVFYVKLSESQIMQYPVQSFRSCFGILRYAEKYGKLALEACCHDAILRGKCNYTYIANTISMYAEPATEPPVDRMSSTLKPAAKNAVVTGIYKDDDSKYSLENLLKRQGEGDLR